MKNASTRIFIVGMTILMLAGCALRSKPAELSASVVGTTRENQAAGQETAGFQRALGPKPLVFPQDFGPHPNYQTEWWYYTGNLDDQDGHHFGYQLTFFRRALLPEDKIPQRASDWATSQVYMAHFALTDVSGQRYQAVERLSRGAVGLAGAQGNPYQVWLQDWQVTATGPENYQITARASSQDGLPFAIDLAMIDIKRPILQGDQGFSQKGPEPGQASYYISQTRLETSGSVRVGEKVYKVIGYSWMDHEYSTSALSENQIGWDWFAIQFEPVQSGAPDQMNELMVFQIRRDDGSVDPYSSGTLIDPQGKAISLQKDQFQIEILETWQSPHSGATYPAGWIVRVPEANLELTITPYLADQELNVSYAYWEGAVKINGNFAGLPVTGSGYVELTGYSGSMGGEF